MADSVLPDDYFDDLLEGERKDPVAQQAAPAAAQAPVTPASNSALGDDYFDSIPVVEDPFERESFSDNVARRAGQVKRGAGEAVASTLEGIGVIGRNLTSSQNEQVSGAATEYQQLLDLKKKDLADAQARFEAGDQEAGKRIQLLTEGIQQLNDKLGFVQTWKEKTDKDLAIPFAETGLAKAGQAVREGANQFMGAPDERDQSFWAKVAEGGGNMAVTALAATAAGIFTGGAGAVAVGGFQGSAANMAQVYKEAIEAGADDKTALEASRWAAGIGATEIIPISRALKFLPNEFRGELTNTFFKKVLEIGKGMGEEAAQEYLAQVANNLVAMNYYDPNRGWDEGALEAGLVGGILGGGTGAIGTFSAPRVEKLEDSAPSSEQQAALGANNGAPATVAPPAPPDVTVAAAMKDAVAKRKQARLAAAGQSTTADTLTPDQIAVAPEPAAVTPESNPPAAQPSEAAQAAAALTPAATTPAAPTPAAALTPAGSTFSTDGYSGPDPDPLRNRIEFLKAAAADESKPEKTRREFLRRAAHFEQYLDARDKMLDAAAVPQDLRAQITSLRPDDIITGQTTSGETVTGRIQGWGRDGIIDIDDADGISHDVSPDKITSIQSAAPTTPAAPAAPTPAAPEAAAPSEAAQAAATLTAQADPMTEQTVPEQPASIEEQRKALSGGTKAAVLYDAPKEGGKAPAKVRGEGIGRQKLPDGRIVDFDKSKLTAAKVLAAFKDGTLNEVLELGPASKADVAESVAAGAEPVVVTETTPEGVPVKEAASTDQLAPEVAQSLEETKTAPENTIATATPEQVVADRIEAQPEQPASEAAQAGERVTSAGNRVPSADDITTLEKTIAEFERLASQVKQSNMQSSLKAAVQQAKRHLEALRSGDPDTVEKTLLRMMGSKYGSLGAYEGFRGSALEADAVIQAGENLEDLIDGMLTPSRAEQPASEAAQAAAALPRIEQTETTDSYTAVAPKAAAVVEIAKRRAPPKKPLTPKAAAVVTRAGNAAVAPKAAPKVEEKPKGRILKIEDPEIEAQYRAAEAEQDAKRADEKKLVRKSAADEKRDESYAELRARLKEGKMSAADEAEERLRISSRSNNQGVSKEVVAGARTQAEIARAVLEENIPDKIETVKTAEERGALRDRLTKIVATAKERLAAARPEGKLSDKAARYYRIPEKAYDTTTADAVVWLKDAEMLLGMLGKKSGSNPDLQAAINDYLIDEQLVRRGDAEQLRARRREMGELANRSQQQDVNTFSIEDIADAERERTTSIDENDSDGDRPASVTASAMRLRSKDATPSRGRALKDEDIIETITLGSALDRIGEVKPKRYPWQTRNIVQKVMGRVRAKLGDLKVHIVSQDAIDTMFPDKEPGSVQGFYRVEKGDIVVTENAIGADGNIDWQLLTHEAVHALVEDGIATSDNLRAQFTELYDYTRDNIDEDQREAYAFEDIHEFIAEALSNPEFQAALQETAIPDAMARKFGLADGQRSVWGAIVSAVRRYIFNDKSIEKVPGKDFDAMSAVLQFAEAFETAGKAPATPEVRATVRSLEERLKAAGLDSRYIAEAVDLLKSELGTSITKADIDEIVAAVKAADKNVTPPSNPGARRGKANAKVTAEVEKLQKQAQQAQVQANTFVPKKDPGSVRGMVWKANNFIAKQSERFYGTENNPVTKITRLMENRRTTRARIVRQMAPAVQALSDLRAKYAKTERSRKTWDEFGNFINDVTSAAVHPDVPLTDPKNAHLGKNAMKGVWGKAQHADLARRYAALPADLREAYASTRDLFTEAQDAMNLGIVRNILIKTGHTDPALAERFFNGKETEADRNLVGQAVAEMIADADELKKLQGPYFPLMRRGNFVVTGRYKVDPPASGATKVADNAYEFKSRKDAEDYARKQDTKATVTSAWVDKTTGQRFVMDKGQEVRVSKNDVNAEQRFTVTVQDQHVEFFDSEREAEAARKEFVKQGMLDITDVQSVRRDSARASADMTAQRLELLAGTLDKRLVTSKLSSQQQAELKGTLFEASLRMLGSTRIQSRRLPRRNVSGASTDVVQNAAEYVMSTAGYLAKLEHAPAMETALKQLDEDTNRLAKTGRSGGAKGATAIRNEMVSRANSESYLEENGELDNWIRRVTSFNFLTKLASPAYSFINSLQPTLLTVPHLAGEYGELRAVARIAQAYRDIGAAQIAGRSVVETAKDVTGKGRDGGYIEDIKTRLKDKAEHALLDRLVEDGAIDPDAGFEVASLARQRKGVAAKVDTGLEFLSSIARQAPQAVEDINRTVTALAAHRLEMERSKDPEKAYRAAWDAVAMTQGIMSNTNSAPIFNSRLGRLALQFKKFSAMTYGTMGYQLGRAIRPMEAGDRVKAIKSLAYMAATHAAFAGVMGIPGMEAAKIALWLFSMLGLTDLSWEEFKGEVEGALASITGEGVAKGVTRGVTSALPFDLDFDLSRRVGADNLALDSGPLNTDPESVSSWLIGMGLGVSGSTVKDVVGGVSGSYNAALDAMTGATSMQDGDFSGLKKLIPLKMLADGITAAEKLERGDYSPQEFVLRTLGLSPTEEIDVSREKGAQIKEAAKSKDERNSLISSYVNAANAGEAARLLGQIRAWNRKNGGRDIGINWIKDQRREERARWQN